MGNPVYRHLAAAGALYLLAGLAGLAVPFTAGNVSPVWPASGVALACLLFFGWRCWPAIYLAAFLINFFSHLPALTSLGLATGNTAAALAGAYLLQRIPGFRPSLTRLRDMLGLVLLAAVLSSTISATVGTTFLVFSGVKRWPSAGLQWLTYYLGDAMGILLVAPLLLSLREWKSMLAPLRAVELSCLLFFTALASVLLFDERLYFAAHHHVLALLVFPFVLWAAIRFRVAGAALVSAVIAAIALIATAYGLGPFSKEQPFINVLLLHLFFAVVTISGLLLSAVIAERQESEAERASLIRKQSAQEAREESDKRYRRIVEMANEGIWTLDSQGRTTFANRQLAQMLGCEADEIAGRNALDFCPDDSLASLQRTGTSELRLCKKNGDEVWAKVSGTPIPEQQGSDGMLLMLADITERNQAERALRASELKYRELVEHANSIILRWNSEGRITFLNEFGQRFFGYSVEEILGRHVMGSIVPSQDSSGHDLQQLIERICANPIDYEQNVNENMLRNGERVWIAWTNRIVRDEQGRVTEILSIGTDITERKRTEEALRQTHRALRVLSLCNSAVVHATDEQMLLNEVCHVAVGPAGYVLAWVGFAENDEARTVRPAASAGPAEGFLDRIHVSWADNEYGRGGVGRSIRLGKPVAVRRLRDQPEFAVWREALASRNFQALLSVPLRQGDSVFGALAIYTEEPDAFDSSEVELLVELGGNLAHGILSLRARNERREAIAALERARNELEDRVRQRTAELVEAKEAAESADRLKSAFLATMSHELRTPLNSIIGFTGIVLQGLAGPLNDEQTKQLGMVQKSSRHLLALINDVLDISKIEAGQLEIHRRYFSMSPAIQKAVELVLPLAQKKGIAVRTEIRPEVGAIYSDQRRSEQILLNLLGNAVKFTDAGEVVVQCWRDNGWLVTAVRDTGIGIDPRFHQSIFEPFRQADTGLARKREGTGLGLSISKRLVEHLGGSISMESEPGKGSTFTVRLPLLQEKTCEEHSSHH